jgi:hypothetical protein
MRYKIVKTTLRNGVERYYIMERKRWFSWQVMGNLAGQPWEFKTVSEAKDWLRKLVKDIHREKGFEVLKTETVFSDITELLKKDEK